MSARRRNPRKACRGRFGSKGASDWVKEGYENIIKYGIGFYKKRCAVEERVNAFDPPQNHGDALKNRGGGRGT